MKPIEQNKFSSSIYGVKVYIDDIELILSKILSLNETFTISDNENSYDNLEELKKYKGNNPSIIKIDSNNKFNYLSIRIFENVASVNSYGNEYNKIAYEIEKIFLRRKSHPFISYFFNTKNARNNIIILSIVLSGIFFYKTYYLHESVNLKQNIWYVVAWLIILLITLMHPNFNGKIELKRRHENSFLKNNKDSILIATITAIITAIITYFLH